ncbi:hypothetical protein MLD38_014984 [Melastoma candidum]|uniref:Uncharacterized protein n=1 Tax=Melastoma candidum TaxID=119954 RepID=A0ACB9REP5_9MYRT|nr:hypothetical protein MLD38_014984 [Melastoma candidum]
MPRDRTKPHDRQRKNFPDRLGSLVHFSGLEQPFGSDLGKELHTFQPHGFGSDREGVGDWVGERYADGVVGDGVDGRHGDREVIGTSGLDRVSVSEVIDADEKRSDLEYELSQEEIDLEKLQRIAGKGLPDGDGSRARVWKLLLGYLPPSRNLWDKELAENRQKYVKLKEELLISPSESARRRIEGFCSFEQELDSGESDGPLQRQEISQEDHPLSLGKASVWHQFFQNTEIMDQIDRDLQRTHPDMKFFSGETPTSRKHRTAMRNILLLFAKLNPAIRYVQGMNEVLAPLCYVFGTDINEQNVANAEADSFACFVRLLSDSVDHFCQQLDNSADGILSTLARLSELLRANDEELWRHLEFTTKVKPHFYAFRWITLLLTQEFDFKSILRIWDSFLGNPFGVQDMLLRVCCAMLLCVKSRLLSGDFIANLKLLQHYPEINIEHLLQVAMDLTPDTSSYSLSL